MLDLEAGVHLDEGELAVPVEQELDRAGADIADRLSSGDRAPSERVAGFFGQPGRRSLLDDLLVAALGGTVALEEMDRVAQGVGEDLDLDMAGRRQVTLQQQPVVAERGHCFAPRRLEGRAERGGILDDAHAASAAARRRLDEKRVADPVGLR